MWILCNLLCLVVSFTVSSNSQNDVRRPPSITEDPKRSVIFKENQAVTLNCKAEGTPAVTYAWKINKEELNLNHANIIRGSEGDITIREATPNDEGFYQCFVTNQHGTALSVVAYVQRAFLDDSSSSDIVDLAVQEGHPFIVPAARRNSVPTPTYEWKTVTGPIDSKPATFKESQRVFIASNGDLHFAYTLKSDDLDGSLYSNIVTNPHTYVSLGGSFTRLTIKEGPSPDFLPNISYFSKSREVALIGNPIELKCFFSGKPLPQISWSRPGSNLPYGRNSILHFGTTLNISNIIASDEGVYVCTATNSKGPDRYVHNISVEAAPNFTSTSDGPHDVNVTEGATVTFNCSAFAIPEAEIVWLRNGQPIDVRVAPERFSFSNDLKSLKISDVCRDCVDQERQTDLMVIQCNASNVHGYAFASGYLNVLMTTKVTLQTYSSSKSDDTKVNRRQFNCNAVSDPSTPPTVQWYRVSGQGDWKSVYNKTKCISVMNGILTQYMEENCSDICGKYLGEHICVGGNRYSKDTYTVRLNCTTDEPKVPPPLDPPNWIVIGIGVVLFLLLLILIFFIVCQLSKGDEYDVDGKERKSGRNPVAEIQATGFHDYYPSEYVKREGSAASLESADTFRSMDDISEYDYDVRDFGEDGSFVGKYGERQL